MTLGAEPKKLVILGVLVAAALGGLYLNSDGDSSPSPAPRPATKPAASVATVTVEKSTAGQARVRGGGRAAGSEFRPRLGSARGEASADQASIDPALRLDLLAKVQAIEPVAAGRNLFQFGVAPVTTPIPAVPKNVPQIPINRPPVEPPAVVAGNPQPAAPPPLNLKYFGYKISKSNGHKEAFLTDGDDIIRVEENQTLKQHYRVVQISLNSLVIEDTQSKSTQTLALQEVQG